MAPSLVLALKRREVKLMMAFVIGFGLATMFRAPCKGFLCRTFVAPDLQEVEKTVWKHGVGCHKVKLDSVPCTALDGAQIVPSA